MDGLWKNLQKQQQKNKYIINMVNHFVYDPSLKFF